MKKVLISVGFVSSIFVSYKIGKCIGIAEHSKAVTELLEKNGIDIENILI